MFLFSFLFCYVMFFYGNCYVRSGCLFVCFGYHYVVEEIIIIIV